MVSLTMIVLVVLCLGLLVVGGVIVLVIGLQNRGIDRDIEQTAPTTQPQPRQTTHDGLEDLQSKQPAVDQATLEEELKALLASGRKIDAIKTYREATGVGLKEAKDAVDDIQQRIP